MRFGLLLPKGGWWRVASVRKPAFTQSAPHRLDDNMSVLQLHVHLILNLASRQKSSRDQDTAGVADSALVVSMMALLKIITKL